MPPETTEHAPTSRPVVVITLDEAYSTVVENPEEWRETWAGEGPFAVVPAAFGRRRGRGRTPCATRHWLAVAPLGVDISRLADRIRKMPHVSHVALRYPAPDPGDVVLPLNDPEYARQNHLRGTTDVIFASAYEGCSRAGHGTNAWFAWRFPGGDGGNTTFVDVERGWRHVHEDLEDIPEPLDVDGDGTIENLISGINFDESKPHGTMVVGIVCARDNDVGVVGIAPRTKTVLLASTAADQGEFEGAVTEFLAGVAAALGLNDIASILEDISIDISPETVAGALDAAREQIVATVPLMPGEGCATPSRSAVVLLEAQTQIEEDGVLLPAEVHDDVFSAVEELIDAGIAVVVVAGNGNFDLDTLPGVAGIGLDDSGSIMVGAVEQMSPHRRVAGSNYGTRVDCWNWGDGVVSCSAEPTDDGFRDSYQSLLGTSGAAAVVAGVAVTTQSLHHARHGRALSPAQLRDLLRAQASPVPAIGSVCDVDPGDVETAYAILPDLRRVVESAPLELPYVWVRSHRRDDGEPCPRHWTSPDLRIERPRHQHAGPHAPFARAHRMHRRRRLVVDVTNRGPGDASAVQVALYSGPLASRAAPWSWQHHGEVLIPSIAAGARETSDVPVPRALEWRARTLAAVVGIAGESPVPQSVLEYGHALEWLQEHMRSVTVRQRGWYGVRPSFGHWFHGPLAVISFVVAGHPQRDEIALLRVELGPSLEGRRIDVLGPPAVVHGLVGGVERHLRYEGTDVAAATLHRDLSPLLIRRRELIRIAMIVWFGTRRERRTEYVRVSHIAGGDVVGVIEFLPEPEDT